MAINTKHVTLKSKTKGKKGTSLDPTQYNYISFPENLGDVFTSEQKTDSGVPQSGVRYPYVCAIFINENAKAYNKEKSIDRRGRTTKAFGADLRTLDVQTNTHSSGFGGAKDALVAAGSAVSKAIPDVVGSNAFTQDITNISPTTYKRLNIGIFLPMPINVSHDYQVSYNDASMGGVLGTALTASNNAVNAENISAGLASAGSDIASSIIREAARAAIANKADEFLGTTNARGIFDKIEGRVQNQRTEQVFDRVQNRRFSFSWVLYPRNKRESDTIMNILNVLKENMMPSLNESLDSGAYYVMPNEFDIEFYKTESDNGSQKFSINKYIPRVSTCVLESVRIDSTPNGMWSAFKSGAPTAVGFTLNFLELLPLYREVVGTLDEDRNEGGY